VGVVDEAVEDGVGDGGIGDDLVPVLDRHLAGDDGRSPLVTIIDDFEEIAALLAGERGEAPIIEDEQVDPRQHLEEPRIASVAAGERQSLEQPWQPMVEDGTIVAACLVAERAGDPALADAGRASDMMPDVWVLRCRSSTRFILDTVTLWAFSAASNTVAKSISSSGNRTAH
jgi:hypothetical protein